MTVDDFMTHLVYTCAPGDSIQSVASQFVRNRIGGAPVVQRGRLVGVVSETDIARGEGARVVADVMNETPVSTRADASLWSAARSMERNRVKRLPVIDDEGHVVGIITRSDLVRVIAREDETVLAAER